jgi:hypothetical protein
MTTHRKLASILSADASYLVLAMNFGQLGKLDRAQAPLSELRRLNPRFEKDPFRYLDMWFTREHTRHVMEGLRKAGLEMPKEKR